MPEDILIESPQKLKREIDHLNSKAHIVDVNLKKAKETWVIQNKLSIN